MKINAQTQRLLDRASSPSALENDILDAIRLVLGDPREYPDVLLWRNNCGVLVDRETDRHVRFGVANPGGADLLGVFTRDGVGIFISAEIKTRTGRQTPEQVAFGELVKARGGSYRVLRSVEDARAWIEQLRRGEA